MSTHTLHFFCGKAGAGKSTLATKVATLTSAVLISEDIWMARLYPTELHTFEDYLKYAERLKRVVGPLVIDLLKHQNVVLDFPANTVEGRKWYRMLCTAARADHTLHYLEAPDDLCLSHIARRNEERPEGSHYLSEETFHHITSYFQAPRPDEGFHVRVHRPAEVALAEAASAEDRPSP